MDLDNSNLPPSPEFLFGTDLLGRDIFSMIWYGGRISLLIGFLSAAVAAVTAVIFGALSGPGASVAGRPSHARYRTDPEYSQSADHPPASGDTGRGHHPEVSPSSSV